LSQLITIPLFREYKILSLVASHAGHTIKGNPHDEVSPARNIPGIEAGFT
jgi:hypothetical protein